jgi:peptidoglycan hydrolase-like protein with peptidoglycan-binding domain
MRRRVIALALVLAAVSTSVDVAAAQDTVSLQLGSSVVAYGKPLAATGAVTPAAAGTVVALELDGAPVGTARTDAAGAFHAALVLQRRGTVVARLASGAASAGVAVDVVPRISLPARAGFAYMGGSLTLKVVPAAYAGTAQLEVRRGGALVGRAAAKVRRGTATLRFRTGAVGRYTLRVTLPASATLGASSLTAGLRVHGRALAVGDRGRDVRELAKRLRRLHVLVPGVGDQFTFELEDAVIAFQKGYRLPRTGAVDDAVWRALTKARQLRPRYRKPALHIEVDKTRQIAMMVRGGKVAAIEMISSGATGNTPEGAFAINNKSPANGTWLGSATLYWAMNFVGNRFALHGFDPVPVYPASHGCVREPIWAAKWLYDHSHLGERVYVYH